MKSRPPFARSSDIEKTAHLVERECCSANKGASAQYEHTVIPTQVVTAGHKAPDDKVLENSAATEASPKLVALIALFGAKTAASACA